MDADGQRPLPYPPHLLAGRIKINNYGSSSRILIKQNFTIAVDSETLKSTLSKFEQCISIKWTKIESIYSI